ncbi:NUDIX domain-containing protein [Streptomyces sp. NPDC006339]|uniref:NUDIX domain-containing protein n=1 Tax=Streptomyces sp. NPDC006339 TaxID=3156755 RepID=UPI0033BDB59B
MTGSRRHTEPLDVHLIAVRDGAAGPEVLLSRRAGDVYAAGCWHLVSGLLDGPWEDVVTALVRETREEPGDPIAYTPAAERLVLVPGPGGPGAAPEERVRSFAEHAVGRIVSWTDVSEVARISLVTGDRRAGGPPEDQRDPVDAGTGLRFGGGGGA